MPVQRFGETVAFGERLTDLKKHSLEGAPASFDEDVETSQDR